MLTSLLSIFSGGLILFNFLLVVQYLGIIILFFELLYVIRQKPSRKQSHILIITISGLINSIGYLFELTAGTKEIALISVKFAYCGKVYILLGMFLFILDYCHVYYSKLMYKFLFYIHTLIVFLVLTCENHKLFYSSIDFTQDGLFPHLVVGHGLFYYLYLILICIYMIVMPFVCIKRYESISDKAEKRQLIYLMIIGAIPMLGFSIYLSNITTSYDTTALSYVISNIILLFSIFRHNLFDTLEAAKDSVIENLSTGIIVIDNNNEILYTNTPGKKVFSHLYGNENKHITDLKKWASSDKYKFLGSKVYSPSIKEIYCNKTLRGKMIVLDDISENYFHTVNLESKVSKQTKRIEDIQHAIISSFANMIEARDGVTGQHVKRTSAYVEIIVSSLRDHGYFKDLLSDSYINNVIHAAPLHDIGKIAIPDSILKKSTKLTNEEFEAIKKHPLIGAEIIDEILSEVEDNEYLKTARDMAYYHHEKWNGSGYPNGLAGDGIPLCARIMAISDVYEALISDRSYKKGYSKEKALSIIKEGSGVHFDPLIVDAFLSVIDKIEKIS